MIDKLFLFFGLYFSIVDRVNVDPVAVDLHSSAAFFFASPRIIDLLFAEEADDDDDGDDVGLFKSMTSSSTGIPRFSSTNFAPSESREIDFKRARRIACVFFGLADDDDDESLLILIRFIGDNSSAL